MTAPLQLSPEIENRVRFVEETDPDDIVKGIVERLRNDVSARDLLTAAALAVSRSTHLPASHHGGPLHPVAGLYAAFATGKRLRGDWALMPVVQNVALANTHIHAPEMGPYIMPALAPAAADGSPEAVAEAFIGSIHNLEASAAERYLLTLLETRKSGEVLDLMLDVAIPRHAIDDHYFLYPVFAARALDCMGWEWAPVVLRPVVRYLATSPVSVMRDDRGSETFVENLRVYWKFDECERLLETHRLLEMAIPTATNEQESIAVGELGARIGACEEFARIQDMLAQALADGLSLEGAGEALSIGTATIHLRTNYGNPNDAHMINGVRARRYLLDVEGVSLRNKILALLNWAAGSEIRPSQAKIEWDARADAETIEALPGGSQQALLDALVETITTRSTEGLDVYTGAGRGRLAAGPEIRKTMALAQLYADKGYDADTFFQCLGELVCRDGFTEMHAIEHLHDSQTEYEATREPYRWVHLVSEAKSAVCSYGFDQAVFEQARAQLAI